MRKSETVRFRYTLSVTISIGIPRKKSPFQWIVVNTNIELGSIERNDSIDGNFWQFDR